jgi:uncharacterized membrane protein YkoI
MLNFLRRMIGRGELWLKPILSAQQACEIAETVVAGGHYAGKMNLSKLETRDGKLIWLISSVTKGSGWLVTIDDATGAVIGSESWGVR